MEFDNQSSIAPSESGLAGRKVMLKLNSAKHGTKAFRQFPQDFKGLMALISKFQKAEADQSTIKLSYQDDTGDVIGLSDDEDLATAYEWAESMPDKNLKVKVDSRKPEKKEASSLLDVPMAQLSIDEKKPKQVVAETIGNVPDQRDRAQTAKQPQSKDKQPNASDSSSSDSETEGEQSTGDQKQDSMVHGSLKVPTKKCPKREDKAYRKARKEIRKMIRRSMIDHSREIINGLVEEDFRAKNEPQITEETKASEEQRDQPSQQEAEAVHHNVECDICGLAPIVGPRFKCTVRKNYDVCQACEAKGGHPHAFLKIPTPDQAPRAMFTIIDENVPGEADIDIDLNNLPQSLPQAFEQLGRHFGGHGPWNRGGRPHHGPPGSHGDRHHRRGPHGPPHHERPGPWNRGRRAGHHGPGGNEEGGTPAWGNNGPWNRGGGANNEGGPGMGGCQMNKHMKNKIGYFMRQMFGNEAMHNAEETQRPEQNTNQGEKNQHKQDQQTKDLQPRRNPKRAIPMQHPTKVHVGCPGDQITVELTFRNGSYNNYKEGMHMEAVLDESLQTVFAPIKIPLPQTEPMGTFTVKVPIQILETADIFLQEHTFLVGVTNPRGDEIGYAVPIKVKIIEKMDETSLYDKAMQILAQTGMTFDDQGSFEKAITALKEADYHVDKACAMLVSDAIPEDKKD